jgi:MOSC domain-containing protein YiiM
VLEEGALQAGDAIELLEVSPQEVTIADVTACFRTKGADREQLVQLLDIPYLPTPLQQAFWRFVRKSL